MFGFHNLLYSQISHFVLVGGQVQTFDLPFSDQLSKPGKTTVKIVLNYDKCELG
jgi:hypothetical protein